MLRPPIGVLKHKIYIPRYTRLVSHSLRFSDPCLTGFSTLFSAKNSFFCPVWLPELLTFAVMSMTSFIVTGVSLFRKNFFNQA